MLSALFACAVTAWALRCRARREQRAADGGEGESRDGSGPGQQGRDVHLRSHAQPFVSRL